jgi:uncharacterized protein (DUF58 family)
MQSKEHTLLDATAISQAETLGLHARYVVEGYMAGEHQSPFRGFAIEFSQHREYTQGDDLRHLDWKVLGRTDRYYIKQYEQETNYVAHILLDGSESMKYGSGKLSKLHYGKMLAACLAYLILLQRDAVALSLFDTQVRTGKPRGETRIGSVLQEMARHVQRKGIVIVLSDLFDDETKVLQGIQHLRFSGHEVILFHILDPYELEFPFKGLVEFDGLEGAGRILTRPNEIRKSYLRELEGFRSRLRQGCERNHTHWVGVNTGRPLHETLSGYLAFRARTTHR